jgi:hypothetical protein
MNLRPIALCLLVVAVPAQAQITHVEMRVEGMT